VTAILIGLVFISVAHGNPGPTTFGIVLIILGLLARALIFIENGRPNL